MSPHLWCRIRFGSLHRNAIMAKGQKKTNKEVRKPKAEKVKTNASNPSVKTGAIKGLEHLKR
ncbi:MAG: hypothetical protein ACI9NG_002035 [Hyphomonas sp.]|jgi:hypothetical protein